MDNIKLQSPCAYQGGKIRLAKNIIDVIFAQNTINEDTKFYDLCCGSGAITLELLNRGINSKNIIMLDISSWGLFWNLVGQEKFDINIFKAYINSIPKDKNLIQRYMKKLSMKSVYEYNEAYVYLILQAASFGGKQVYLNQNKWQNPTFRSYWQPTISSKRRSVVNPMMPMPETLLNRVDLIVKKCKGLTCFRSDINDFITRNEIYDNSIVYIDAPYNNTAKYGFCFDINKTIKLLIEKNIKHLYLSMGEQISTNAICLSKGRNKGGMNGKRKKPNEEWLNIF